MSVPQTNLTDDMNYALERARKDLGPQVATSSAAAVGRPISQWNE